MCLYSLSRCLTVEKRYEKSWFPWLVGSGLGFMSIARNSIKLLWDGRAVQNIGRRLNTWRELMADKNKTLVKTCSSLVSLRSKRFCAVREQRISGRKPHSSLFASRKRLLRRLSRAKHTTEKQRWKTERRESVKQFEEQQSTLTRLGKALVTD